MEYSRLEPFNVDDQQFGLLRATIAAAGGAKNVDPRDFSIGGILKKADALANPAGVEAFDRALGGRR